MRRYRTDDKLASATGSRGSVELTTGFTTNTSSRLRYHGDHDWLGKSAPLLETRPLITALLRSKAARFTGLGRLLLGFNAFWAHAIAVNGEPCDPGRLLPNGPLPVKPSRTLPASAPIMYSLVVRGGENKQGARGATDDYEWDCHWPVSILGYALW